MCMYLCILAKTKYRKDKLESNEIDYLRGWLGPGSKGWEDANGSEGMMRRISLSMIFCILQHL